MSDRVLRARGRRRRDILLRAALDVIGSQGVSGCTHRAVARAARVPLATTTYYFDSIDDLLEAALECFVEDEIVRLEALGARVGAVEGDAPAVLGAITHELAEACVPAQFELYVHAARRPPLQKVVRRSLGAYRALAEALLRQLGAREPERAAPLVVAFLDGLAVQHVAVGDPDRERHITDGLAALLTPFLQGDPIVAASP
jgi:TetR/AcrR family transcriptional regulator, regulator of biofilm formation and stress response